MRSILSILSLLFVLLAGMSAQAGPLEDGLDAYRLGEWDKAFAVLQPLAQAGNPAAQEKIGRLYQRGKGVERDYALAAQWYRRAADQGESQAQTRLAMMLRYGIGPRHDYAEAMKWYRAGAALGNKLAQVGLGYMLMEGVGLPVDYKAAAEWFEKAAAQGDASAMMALGTLCEEGRGVAKDLVQAWVWYSRASVDDGEYDDALFARAETSRDAIAQRLSPAELAEAKRRAAETPPVPRK